MVGVLQVLVVVIAFGSAIGGIVLLNMDKIKSKNKSNKDNNKNTKSKSNNKKENKNSSKDKSNVLNSQDFLEFDYIQSIGAKENSKENKGLIVRKNNKEYVMAIEVYGVNYNLLSTEEKYILEESFQRLLNGIDYPIQIYIQSRKIDIDNYSQQYDKRINGILKNVEALKNTINALEREKVSEKIINDKKITLSRLVSQYNYGLNIKDYIVSVTKSKSMIEKKYFIILSYTPIATKEDLTRNEIINKAYFDLYTKANSIISALQRSKLDGKILSDVELTEVLYCSYNKSDSEIYKLRKAFNSHFNHYVTTSEPVEMKLAKNRIEKLEKEEEEEKIKLKDILKEGEV